jgi:DNA-directed RNA polymerase subunit RPC12/RpoP
VNVLFTCPTCEAPARVPLDHPNDWQCPACDHRHHFDAGDPALTACAVCGNRELYKQKDFPHRLGLLVLVAPLALSIISYYWYEKWVTYALLIGSALVDGVLYYLWVGDAIVCYRCGAYHKGFVAGAHHQPFEVTIGERYRQERIRREQLKSRQTPDQP